MTLRPAALLFLSFSILTSCKNDPPPPIPGNGESAASSSSSTPASNEETAPFAKVLPVNFSPQDTQVWCWAAVSQMVIDYYGYFYYQSEIVSFTFGFPCTDCPGSLPQMQSAMWYMGGVDSLLLPFPLTFNEIQNEIAAGQDRATSFL